MSEPLCKCGHPHSRHVKFDNASDDALYCIQCDCQEFEAAELDDDGGYAPDVVGELIGWRAWKVIGPPEKPRLYSAYGWADKKTMLWPTNSYFTAICPKGHEEDIPVQSCTCGIYAAMSRTHLVNLGYNGYSDEQLVVIGKVGFVGKVIPGTQGYRAEMARVVELFLPYEFWEFAKALEADYQVPVNLSNTWEDEPESTDEDGEEEND